MRWKLILIASLLASAAGSALTLAVVYLLFGSAGVSPTSGISLLFVGIVPVLVVLGASFFVYRHTARRRTIQALITALVSAFLILSIVLGSVLFSRQRRSTLAPIYRSTVKE
jgi:RsiW-degrading membrane proteinase PrsW (M82 family)